MRPNNAATMAATKEPLLTVEALEVNIETDAGTVHAVRSVSISLAPGRVLGIVGESGSGKSITVLALLGLLPLQGRVTSGTATFDGVDLLGLNEDALRRLRGDQIGMIFQDPLTSLNPLMPIGSQLVEAIRIHDRHLSKSVCREKAVDMLAAVGLPNPRTRLQSYPHELSGGMRQRVMIAMAAINEPDLLIADEPTTALDVTTQAQVLETLRSARDSLGSAMILITHDLSVIAENADDVAVMYAGRIVESGPVREIFANARHPYTQGLLRSHPTLADRGLIPIPGNPPDALRLIPGCSFAPRCDRSDGRAICIEETPQIAFTDQTSGHAAACHFANEYDRVLPAVANTVTIRSAEQIEKPSRPLLEVRDLVKRFDLRRIRRSRKKESFDAVAGVSLDVFPGRTFALVGESGCGKSTTARSLLRLIEPDEGTVRFDGQDLLTMDRGDLVKFRTQAQIVFQDSYSSLNPRRTVGDAIGEPMRVHGLIEPHEEKRRVEELLNLVRLDSEHAQRFSHEFSGGQRQRIAIARAISLEPQLLVLDEPVSALDVSIQAQLLALLSDLQKRLHIAYLLIAHDLAMVRHFADDVAIMYAGRIVEQGPVEQVYESPQHPYTQMLLSAVPRSDPDEPRPSRIPFRVDRSGTAGGCLFQSICPSARALCSTQAPTLASSASDSARLVACHFPDDVLDNFLNSSTDGY